MPRACALLLLAGIALAALPRRPRTAVAPLQRRPNEVLAWGLPISATRH